MCCWGCLCLMFIYALMLELSCTDVHPDLLDVTQNACLHVTQNA